MTEFRDLAALKRLGLEHLTARRFDAAAEVYEAAADLSEVPRGGLCVKLARAHLEAGRPEAAATWLTRLVGPATGFKTFTSAARVFDRCPVETWPRVQRRLKVALVSTWTTSTFAPLLRLAAATRGVATDIHEPPFGQYFNETLDAGSQLHAEGYDALILCPDHHALGLRAFSDTPDADVDAAVARWSEVWEAVRRVSKPVILQLGFASPESDPLGHHGRGLPGARRNMIERINAGLAERAAEADVGFVDVAHLARRIGSDIWFEDRSWYMAKIPFSPEALPLLTRHTAAVLAARLGLSRRALVFDLDNTLWGGVIGDDGLGGITIGGGAEGEAFADFQVAIKELSQRGIVLAVCSKNDPEVAREPFRAHPEMVLDLGDIAVFESSWGPKSEGIRIIAEKLGLGLDSLTFLDDNPYERAEVRRALPEVDVPVLPPDPAGFRRALEAYPFFEPASFTQADRARTVQYRARAEAEALRADAGSLEDYQASLGMVARIGPVDAVNLARAVQLINKTNQFNLTTRRRNQAELEAFLARPDVVHFWVRLHDKFADHGLIALALAEVEGDALAVDTLLMSCRVIGRGVEALVLAELARHAAARGCRTLRGSYVPTARNGMVADLYARLGMTEIARDPAGGATWAADPGDLDGDPPGIALERMPHRPS